MLQKLNNPVVAMLMVFFFSSALLSCSGGGSSNDPPGDTDDQSGITLSATQLSPGQFLTIYHPSIETGDEVVVTFEGTGGYVVRAKTGLTEDGSAKVPVPPIIDTATLLYGEGEVRVSMDGVGDNQPLYIEPLQPVQNAEPGEITRAAVDFAIENLSSGLQDIESYADRSGADLSASILAIEEQLSFLQTISAELEHQQLTLETGNGAVVLTGEDLQRIDQLIAAGIFSTAEALGWTPETTGSARASFMGQDQFDPYEILEAIKDKGVPGMQMISSHISVILALAGLLATTYLGPLGVAFGAGAAIVVTAATTLVCCLLSGFSDLTIGLLETIEGEGEGIDATFAKAGMNMMNVIESSLRSIIITAASVPQWPGAIIATLVGLVNDSNDAYQGARDIACEDEEQNDTSAHPELTRAVSNELCEDGPHCHVQVHNMTVYYSAVQGEPSMPSQEPGAWFWNESPEKWFWLGNKFIGSWHREADFENHDDYVTIDGSSAIVFCGSNVVGLTIVDTMLTTLDEEPITGTHESSMAMTWSGKAIPRSSSLRYPEAHSEEYLIAGKEIENYLRIEKFSRTDLISYGRPNQSALMATHIECFDDSEIFIGCK